MFSFQRSISAALLAVPLFAFAAAPEASTEHVQARLVSSQATVAPFRLVLFRNEPKSSLVARRIEIRIVVADARTIEAFVLEVRARYGTRRDIRLTLHLVVSTAIVAESMDRLLRRSCVHILGEDRARQSCGHDSDSAECFDIDHRVFHLNVVNPSS